MDIEYGTFFGKRGASYRYKIYSDDVVEVWQPTVKRCAGGWKTGPDRFVKPTKEMLKKLSEEYGRQIKTLY